mgnify:CR=1 FL=1
MENIKDLQKNIESNNSKIKFLQAGVRKNIQLASPGQSSGDFSSWHNWVYFPSLLVALTALICIPLVYFAVPESIKVAALTLLLPVLIISFLLCLLVRRSVLDIYFLR